MGAREDILSAIRKAAPPPVALPDLAGFGTRYPDLRARFAQSVQENGGTCLPGPVEEALHKIPAYAAAKRIVSQVPGVSRANVDLDAVLDPHDLRDLDFCVLRGVLGVAENAAVWIPEFPNRAAAFLTQHLAIVVEGASLVSNMHEAYDRLTVGGRFGTFIAGPSKTADIEQALVIGAHGARSCTVIVL